MTVEELSVRRPEMQNIHNKHLTISFVRVKLKLNLDLLE